MASEAPDLVQVACELAAKVRQLEDRVELIELQLGATPAQRPAAGVEELAVRASVGPTR